MPFKPDAIIVHESASEFGDADFIRHIHMVDRGWSDIGYHAVILNGHRKSKSPYVKALDGKIEPGRPEWQYGAHCAANGMNFHALGVCLVGYPGKGGYPTERQIDALIHWLATKCRQYGIQSANISQHSDHDRGKPLCASLDMAEIRRRVKTKLEATM